MTLSLANVTSICGMILDILGAVLISRTFLRKSAIDVIYDVGSFGRWDWHTSIGARDLLISSLIQTQEAKAGALILAIGFAFQSIAQFLPSSVCYWSGNVTPLNVIILLIIFSYKLFRWLELSFIRKAARESLEFYDRTEKAQKHPKEAIEKMALRRDDIARIAANPAGVCGLWALSGSIAKNIISDNSELKF